MWPWLRRSFVTGFVVTVPLAASLFALLWLFRVLDSVMRGLDDRLIGLHIPGLGVFTMAVLLLVVGAVATNVLGRRLLGRGEKLLLHVPVFRTIYGPLKQMISAFSPENEQGFKRVVLIEIGGQPGDLGPVYRLGFLTKEFVLNRDGRAEPMVAVYLPTNQLYLGDVVVCARDRALFPDLTVEQGVSLFLTGGMSMPPAMAAGAAAEFPQGPESER